MRHQGLLRRGGRAHFEDFPVPFVEEVLSNGKRRRTTHASTGSSAETNSTIFEYSIVTVPFECLSTYTNYLGKYVIGPHVMFTCFEMAS